MESSRRYLSNDMAEHSPILKNNQITYHPRFGFTPKTGIAFPKTGFVFTVMSSVVRILVHLNKEKVIFPF